MNNKPTFTIELGSEVISRVSGFAGTVTSRMDQLNNCNRYFVQPRVGKDGKLPDGFWTDETELSVTKAGIPRIQLSFKFGLSDKVKSTVTGFEGVITGRSEHLNGCLHCIVQPRVDKDGKSRDSEWFREGDLALVKAVEKTVEPTRTGGFPSKKF